MQPTSSSQNTGGLSINLIDNIIKVTNWLRDHPSVDETDLVGAVNYVLTSYVQTRVGTTQMEPVFAEMVRNMEQIPTIMGQHPKIFPSVMIKPTKAEVNHVRKDRNRHLGEGGRDEDHYGAVLTFPHGGSGIFPEHDYRVTIEEIGGEDVLNNVSTRHFGAKVQFSG